MIIFAVVDIEAGRDAEVWATLCDKLEAYEGDSIKPLVANQLLENGDISLVLSASKPQGNFARSGCRFLGCAC